MVNPSSERIRMFLKSKKIAAALCAGLVLSLMPVAGASAEEQATGTSVEVDAPAIEINVDDLGPNVEWDIPETPVDPDGIQIANPALLGPVDRFKCNNPKNSNWNITSYKAKNYSSFVGGKVALKCGTSAAGYKHIKDGHGSQWQQQINAVGGTGNWDDLMSFATKQILSHPGMIRYAGSNKLCYTAPIEIANSKRTKKVKLNPTVIISTNNKLVITSYPTKTKHNCP